ncbi:uncharacterized protein BP5553_05761 [Venustampulla echinocandica]|uniref:Uncharacterized protein n=1 Tax=Venustampulla echinocandica TaxID=2656787 RepID=A0A370TLL9_9HELO|nr:uncharacterized protein BP5553_05761 [Venustampulla echinocandica]RDL36409.1 hypothetical protein BP5553_05761 [Venustampulla echinocandica]
MPNWKSYESSVRLLSAIIAANPNLKLNYDEVGKYYGGGTTYKAVWGRMTQINKHAKLLATAVENGQDPIEIELNDKAQNGKPKAQDISTRFGGDCTKSAIENRFRRIKSDAKLINNAVAKGIDPITLNIGDASGEVAIGSNTGGARRDIAKHFGSDTTAGGLSKHMSRHVNPNIKLLRDYVKAGGDAKDMNIGGESTVKKEIAACFGSDATPGGIRFQLQTSLKPNVKLIKDARAAGQDCKTLGIGESDKPESRKAMSKYFGSDSTKGGIEFQFRTIKADAKRQRECYDAGGDPKTLNIGSGKEISRYLNDGTTTSALDHRFRPIKKDAIAMRAGAAIANQYGEGVSGKAVSTYFERARKDPHWNLSNTVTENGGTPAKSRTPRGPAKKRVVKNEDDDDDEEEEATPSKKPKAPLHKVKNGRVAKQNGRARVPAPYVDEEDDDDNMIKPETASVDTNTYDAELNANEHFYPAGEDFDDGHYEG